MKWSTGLQLLGVFVPQRVVIFVRDYGGLLLAQLHTTCVQRPSRLFFFFFLLFLLELRCDLPVNSDVSKCLFGLKESF